MDKEKLMKKMMGEKEEGSDMKKDAKLSVLKELRKMASDMMGDDLKGGMMKKVTVASPTKEGLQHGLEKAEDMMDHNSDADMEEESEEGEPMDEEDLSNCSPEELKAKIAKLQAALANK